MPARLLVARVTALAILLAVLVWLPGVAANWFGDPRPGDGPRLVYLPNPSGVHAPDERRPEELPGVSMPTESVPRRIDLRGNEIVRPVARYGVDHQGALYEMHSPETEVPQLSPPEL